MELEETFFVLLPVMVVLDEISEIAFIQEILLSLNLL
jgi:hypothetical protein